ncbi:hypothetical protein ACFSCX_13350 [Bacillus salitolerans]|uniref:Uncharacterized protein n=1 Tax=Bacillus salitolerans TaxID=1437434 RepID=A0ABW4LQT7_9BACI
MRSIGVRNSLFTNSTIEHLVNSYDIGEVKSCSFLIRGLNDTYVVEKLNVEKIIFIICLLLLLLLLMVTFLGKD